jgi:hypothetical protein
MVITVTIMVNVHTTNGNYNDYHQRRIHWRLGEGHGRAHSIPGATRLERLVVERTCQGEQCDSCVAEVLLGCYRRVTVLQRYYRGVAVEAQ